MAEGDSFDLMVAKANARSNLMTLACYILHEVVEDYRSKGLTLRQHPLAFLRRT